MIEGIIRLDKSVIVAADVESSKLVDLVKNTCLVEGIGGYKIGLELGLERGLPQVVGSIKEQTELPVIYDHQKAGNDIPEMGSRFADVCKRAGVDAVILFPFGGGKTERDWIKACQGAGLGVLVGAHMTQPEFLYSEGGSIADQAPDRIFTIAAENGVRDFVVPGNKIDYVRHYKELLDKLLGEGNFTLYAPGFITQGGEISEFAKAAGDKWHAIVGSAIYKAVDMGAAARQMTKGIVPAGERIFDPRSPDDSRSREGLTIVQEQLACLLFDTKIVAPVTRRTTNPDGTYSFSKIERPTAPIDFAQEGEFALKLHETHPEAPLSPVYINLRNLPEIVLSRVGAVLAEMGGKKPDLCAGIPKAGVPLARAYSEYSGVPVRDDVFDKEQTQAGRKITIGDSENHTGETLRIIDDLATQGQTKLEAIKAAEQMGYKITDIVVLVDRQQGATQQLAELGYTLRSAFTIDQLLRYGVRTGRISPNQYNTVHQYLGLS